MSWITKFLTTILCFQAVFSSGRTTLDRFLEDDSFFLGVSRLGAGASGITSAVKVVGLFYGQNSSTRFFQLENKRKSILKIVNVFQT